MPWHRKAKLADGSQPFGGSQKGVHPSWLIGTFLGPIARIMVSRRRGTAGARVVARRPHVPNPNPNAVHPCSCKAFKAADQYWQLNTLWLKPIWDAAVKNKHYSGYQLFMNECIPCLTRFNAWPKKPGDSGGFSTKFLCPNLDDGFAQPTWLGKAPPFGPPLAAFNWSPGTNCPPPCIQFHDLSRFLPTSWLWHFGDNTTSTEQSPRHCFPGGPYTARLEVTNAFGKDSVTRTVDDFLPIELHNPFSLSPATGTSPLTVTFSNTSLEGFDSFFWDFGDGYTSTETNTTHTYTTAGNYTATLTSAGQCGYAISTHIVNATTPTSIACPSDGTGLPYFLAVDLPYFNIIQDGWGICADGFTTTSTMLAIHDPPWGTTWMDAGAAHITGSPVDEWIAITGIICTASTWTMRVNQNSGPGEWGSAIYTMLNTTGSPIGSYDLQPGWTGTPCRGWPASLTVRPA